jgi:hypothetical protein
MAGISRVDEQLLGSQEGQMPLGEAKSRWKENNKMDFREVAEKRDLWRAVVNTVMNFWLLNSRVDEQLLGSREGRCH